jgi:uncharacterized iron-regulated protein
MTPKLRQPMRLRAALPCVVAWLVAACTNAPPPAELRFAQPLVLLGEVHDNAMQHALRYRAFAAHIAGGARPALALEQLDRGQQDAIDRMLAAPGAPDADAFIAAFGARGWTWPYYRPFIALALEHRLPIVAANVSRDEARGVMRDGLAAQGFDAAVPAAVMAAHLASIEASHCGQVDAALAGRMALAQVARDQQMASVVARHADRGVVLLAGNGHVRNDIGVPRWLDASLRGRAESIGWLEEGGAAAAGLYDRQVVTAAQPRADPCAAMKSAPTRRP